MFKCPKLRFHPYQISKGVFGMALDGTIFNMYTVVFKSSLHKDIGNTFVLQIMLLTISIMCVISSFDNTILLWCTYHSILGKIPSSRRNFANGSGCCPFFVYLPQYSPPLSDFMIFLFFSFYFSTSALKTLKASSASDFSYRR